MSRRCVSRFVEGLIVHLQNNHRFCEHKHDKLNHTALRVGSKAANELWQNLRDFAQINKMCFYTRCRESACIEGLHRVNIKYAYKLFFFAVSFAFRVALAQLDWNCHRPLYVARMQQQRARKQEVGAAHDRSLPPMKKVRAEQKSYDFRSAIRKNIFWPRSACEPSWARYVPPTER
jgi:hypothetical protein